MRYANIHAGDFKIGDIVFVPELVYLNQKHERYSHEPWENIETIQVKVIRTTFKGIVNNPYKPFNTCHDVRFRQVFHTFSEAVDCLSLHPYIMERLKMQGAVAFLDKAFNVMEPDELTLMVDAKTMEMMR